MNVKPEKSAPDWVDPDDGIEWSEEQLERAEFAIGGTVVRPARGTLTTPFVASGQPKEQIILQVDRDVADALMAKGERWRADLDAMLRRWLDLRSS